MKLKKKVEMLQGPIFPNVIRFAIPLMISGILQLLFNAIDMIVVGKFSGSASMAAVSSTGSLVNLVTNLFIGLSVGSSVEIARRIGSGDRQKVRDAVHTSILLSLVAGSVLMLIGIALGRVLLEMMKSPEDVIDLSALYLRWYFTGMPATMVYNFGSAILRAKGDTRRPLQALTIAGVANALLNLFFVVVWHMDVAGVGLASSISSYISAILVLNVLRHDHTEVHLDIRHLYIEKNAMLGIIKIGLPAGIQGTVFSLSNVVIQSSINSYGKIVMAGNGAATSIEGFVSNAMAAFYQTCLTFASQNSGAKQYGRVLRILFICMACECLTGFVLGNGAYLGGSTLLRIYASEEDVIAAGLVRLGTVGRYYFIFGTMDVFVGALRGMGTSFVPMIVSLLGVCAFRLVYIATYFQTHHTIEVLYASYPLSWTITLCAHSLCFLVVYITKVRKERKTA